MYLFAILLASSTIGDAVQPELHPYGHPSLEYATKSCILSREYQSDSKLEKATLVFQPLPTFSGEPVLAYVIRPIKDKPLPDTGAYQVTFSSSDDVAKGTYKYWRVANANKEFLLFSIGDEAYHALLKSTSMAVRFGQSTQLSFDLTGTDKAFSALATCKDDLLKSFGVDAAQQHRISTPAVAFGGSPMSWYSPDDYPLDALRESLSGTAVVLYKIGVNGKVKDCQTVSSSGLPSIDAITCSVALQRGRYKPALDKDGTAIETYDAVRINWQIPH
ncbi:energy transducer TonB [Sphingomonas sp. RIT328]|uniref:energy transducer TonB n=1 Tax=Sphingomonas sp. RIT328 TaxID=1470591 RepID=UPI00044E8439|nr:energy transducer TonB [Sphingomonas sp. RIT328]EZP55157.1 Outer membrane transport energization protein TonB [Sphingomonas sp. RIT328]